MRAALKGRPLRVVDKTRLRYVLYRATPSPKLLRWTLDLLPRHPEHIDAFVAYLSKYSHSNFIMERITSLLRTSGPYDYVQGELWQIATGIGKRFDLRRLVPSARRATKQKDRSIALERGLMPFFVAASRADLYSRSAMVRRVRAGDPYVQSLVVPTLSDAEFKRNGLISALLRSAETDPGLAISGELVRRGVAFKPLGVQTNQLSPQVRNAFEGLGIISAPSAERFDQIGDILRNRYNIAYWRKWRELFALQYSHALQLLLSAEAKYLSDRSEWLSWQNSFNDAMFRAIQRHLQAAGLHGACSTTNRYGELIPFGSLLDPQKAFAQTHPAIATPLRMANDRRNRIPTSHPYETKTGAPTQYLKARERDDLARQLAAAYEEVINLLNNQV